MAKSMYETVLRLLDARKGDWRQIADGTGVPYSTLCKVAQGHIPSPSVHTIQTLYDYLTAPSLGPAARSEAA